MQIVSKEIYQCGICAREYLSMQDAERCEAQGVATVFPAGTFVGSPYVAYGPRSIVNCGEVQAFHGSNCHVPEVVVRCGEYGMHIFPADTLQPICRICLKFYDTVEAAEHCAAQGLPEPKFRVGQGVRIADPYQGKVAEVSCTAYRIAAILWPKAPEIQRLCGIEGLVSHAPIYYLPDTFIRSFWTEDELEAVEKG